jgi:hypothetical protein
MTDASACHAPDIWNVLVSPGNLWNAEPPIVTCALTTPVSDLASWEASCCAALLGAPAAAACTSAAHGKVGCYGFTAME